MTLSIDSFVYHRDEPFPFTEFDRTQLTYLSKTLQSHLNVLNKLSLPLQNIEDEIQEQSEVFSSPLTIWTLRLNNSIVGYATTYTEGHPVLASFVISPHLRQQGLGKRFLFVIRHHYAEASLKVCVLKKDISALQFYHSSQGFIDYDHIGRFTHLMIFPPVTPKRESYALPREHCVDSPNQNVDFREPSPYPHL